MIAHREHVIQLSTINTVAYGASQVEKTQVLQFSLEHSWGSGRSVFWGKSSDQLVHQCFSSRQHSEV